MKIAIAGAGLIGRMCAWQLSQSDKISAITLFDKDDTSGEQSSAWVAAAMLAPISESVHAPPDILKFGLQALDLWPDIVQQLQAQTQSTITLQNGGSIVIAHQQDQNLLDQFLQQLQHHQKHDTLQCTVLDQQQLHSLAPQLDTRFNKALHLHKEACLDNHQLLNALAQYLLSHAKVQWHTHTPVSTLSPYSVTTATQQQQFDYVIDCRGAGAIAQDEKLRGVRGEIIWVKASEVNIKHAIRLMHPRYKLYIAPHANNIYAVGATEIESQDTKNITVRSSLELLSALYSVSSRFAEAEILASYARLRPAYKNHLPQINYCDGLLKINGLYRHGYLLAPIISKDILNYFESGSAKLWPDIFNPYA